MILFKGLPLPLAGTMIETATLFTSMGQMRKFLVDNPNDKLTVAQTCIAGGGAGFMVSFVLTPIELVKCRMQVANAPYVGRTIRMLRIWSIRRGPLVQCDIRTYRKHSRLQY